MLNLNEINVYRGHTHVIKNVSMAVETGEIHALVGANGAGKSTLLMSVAGVLPIHSGTAEVKLNQKKLNLLKSNAVELVSSGLVLCPEGRQIFAKLSIEENLKLGAFVNNNPQQIRRLMHEFYEMFPVLGERRHLKAGNLSGGEQMMLAIARALMSEPKLLMLDEPSLGLAPMITAQIFDTIRTINQEKNVTIILVEQNAVQALNICHHGLVLAEGQIVKQGSGKDLLEDQHLTSAYLGH